MEFRKTVAVEWFVTPAKAGVQNGAPLRDHAFFRNDAFFPLGDFLETVMDMSQHTLNDLFAQLGLPSEASAIDGFVRAHAPLPTAVRLAEAPFWTPAQASFLREEILKDADWAEVVDGLDELLRA